MNLHLREAATKLEEQSPVLDDEGVCPQKPRLTSECESSWHLLALDDDIGRHVNAYTREMRPLTGRLEGVGREVARLATGVEVVSEGAVDGVCACRKRYVERPWITGRCEQLGHFHGRWHQAEEAGMRCFE